MYRLLEIYTLIDDMVISSEILEVVSLGVLFGIASKLMYNLTISAIYALVDIMK